MGKLLGVLYILLLMVAASGIFWFVCEFGRRVTWKTLILVLLMLVQGAFAVEIPDPNLRTVIEAELGVTAGDPITVDEMATLTRLDTGYAAINDLTGLEAATNLQHLNLIGNAVTDISPLTGLTNLKVLRLEGNAISDLSPLVENVGLGNGDKVVVDDNPLNEASINAYIPLLVGRGVWVGRAHLFFAPIKTARVGEIFRLNVVLDESLLLSGWSFSIAFTPGVTDAPMVVEVIEVNALLHDSYISCSSNGSGSTGRGQTRLIEIEWEWEESCYNEAGGALVELLVEARSPGKVTFNLSDFVLRDRYKQPILDIQMHPHEIIVEPNRDLNGDGRVDILDLTLVSQYFGQSHPQADVNGDGTVNILDLTAVARCLDE